MGNRFATKYKDIDNNKPASSSSPAGSSVDHIDSAREQDEGQEDVYVAVTVLAKKIRTTENPQDTGKIIELKQLLVWNYYHVPEELSSAPREYFMQHVTSSAQIVDLGICTSGPFGPVQVTSPPECRIIYFTGPDDNFTMSNQDYSLYLRARPRQKDVVARAEANNNSNFLLLIKGISSRGAAICVIKPLNNPALAFKYNDDTNVVVTDTYDDSDVSFQFELSPSHPTNVHFVDNNRCNIDI